MAKEYQQPGDYVVKELSLENFEGKKIDIYDLMKWIEYEEDIFQNVQFGKIQVADAIDFVQYFPIIGQEILRFRYTVDNDKTISKKFYVYKVGNKQEANNQALIYNLFFVSYEALENENKVIEDSYKGETADQVVRKALQELNTEKKLLSDSTENLQHIVSPKWSPLELINWCTTVSKSKEYEGSLYLFYENSEGFNFKHLESLFDQDPVEELESRLENIENNQGKEQTLPGRNIQSVRIVKTQNTLKQIQDGMFSGRIVSYDNVNKEIQEKDYDYESQFESFSHLGNSKLNTSFGFKSPDQKITLIPTKTFRENSGYFSSNEGQAFSKKHEETYEYRSSQLSQLEAIQVEIVTYGIPSLTAGKVINLSIPNRSTLEEKKKKRNDKFLEGKELITQVKHVFSSKVYEQVIRCSKDSLNTDIESEIEDA